MNEFANPSLLIENHYEIESIIENSEFVNDLINKKNSNFTELEKYSTILDYLKNQNEIIMKEISEFKKG